MDAEFDGGLLGLLAGTHERDSASTKLRRIGTGHEDEPSGSGHHLATETGTLSVGQVKMSPTHSASLSVATSTWGHLVFFALSSSITASSSGSAWLSLYGLPTHTLAKYVNTRANPAYASPSQPTARLNPGIRYTADAGIAADQRAKEGKEIAVFFQRIPGVSLPTHLDKAHVSNPERTRATSQSRRSTTAGNFFSALGCAPAKKAAYNVTISAGRNLGKVRVGSQRPQPRLPGELRAGRAAGQT